MQHDGFVLVTEGHVVKNPFQNFVAILEEEKHGVNHDEEIEKKARRSGGHARRESDEECTDRLRSCGKVLQKLLLTGNMLSQGRKAQDEPVMRVEIGGRAEVLHHPWNRMIAYSDRLLCNNSEKGAEWCGYQNEKNKQGHDSAERRPPTQLARDPLVKGVGKTGENRAKKKRLYEGPYDDQEKRGHRRDKEKDENNTELARIDAFGLHTKAFSLAAGDRSHDDEWLSSFGNILR